MPFRQLRRGQLDTLHVLSTRKSLLLPTHFYPLYAIISILRLLFRNISHVIILTKREQENENERWRNLGDYQCSLIFLLLHIETFDECARIEDIALPSNNC